MEVPARYGKGSNDGRATFPIGGDGRTVKAGRKVKVPGHAEAVLAAGRGLARAASV